MEALNKGGERKTANENRECKREREKLSSKSTER